LTDDPWKPDDWEESMSDTSKFNEGYRIVSLFDQGKRFTEELLKENERLRNVIKNLSDENRGLKRRMHEEGVSQLIAKLELVEREKASLEKEIEEQRKESQSIEEENREFAERYVQVEKQNSDLISMYVASYQLHSTLDYNEVLTTVKDITINMMGGESFGIYLIDNSSKKLIQIAAEGLDDLKVEPPSFDDEIITQMFESGNPHFLDYKAEYADGTTPVAYLPLTLGESPFGVIVIYKLLIQKEGFQSLDYELVELLGKHAASALYSAKIHTISERKRHTLQGFLDLIKWEVGEGKQAVPDE
jgi:hypothetical protein